MALIAYIDGPTRRVFLSADTVGTTMHPMDYYREMRTLRANNEELRKYDPFFTAFGNITKTKIGEITLTATERFVMCMGGTKTVPYDATQEITINGTIITDNGYEGVYTFDRSLLSVSTIVDINYVPPQVEVITVNTGNTAPTVEEIADEVETRILISDVNNIDEVAISISKIGYITDIANLQIVQVNAEGVEIARFNCFNEYGSPSLTNIKSMVLAT